MGPRQCLNRREESCGGVCGSRQELDPRIGASGWKIV